MPEAALEAPRVPSSARHYAEAVFELAREEGDLGRWERRLERIEELLSDPELAEAVSSPVLSLGQKLELCRALLAQDDRLDREAGNLLLVLVSGGRTQLLGAIREGYQELVDRQQGRVRAELTTAVRLSPEVEARLARSLSERLRLEVRFRSRVDPELLGGAVVRVGDRVFDASLRTKLEQLRQDLLSESASR